MKKILGIALVLALAVMLVPGIALADDPTVTTVNIVAGSSGVVTGTVTAKDAKTTFTAAGTNMQGNFYAKDSNNNAAYGIDDFTTNLKAQTSQGYIEYRTDRLTSGTAFYGAPGQASYSFVQVQGPSSFGSLAMNTDTNYAYLDDNNYGFCTPDGLHQFQVSNTISTSSPGYIIEKWVSSVPTTSSTAWLGTAPPTGSFARVYSYGQGAATLGCQDDTFISMKYATSDVALGWWPGGGRAYPHSTDFDATGTGYFEALGIGNNKVTFMTMGFSSTGNGTPGSATAGFFTNWTNGSSHVNNYGLTVEDYTPSP